MKQATNTKIWHSLTSMEGMPVAHQIDMALRMAVMADGLVDIHDGCGWVHSLNGGVQLRV